ncbi:hypothetical protein GCM10028807_47150 [Spirosoma daeguense]
MRNFMPDSSDSTGNDSSNRSVDTVPSGLDNDPEADEEVIDQQAGEQYPKPVEQTDSEQKETEKSPDKLAESIAYALDGTGPGPTNDTPNVSGHDVIFEGSSGTGTDEEKTLFGN